MNARVLVIGDLHFPFCHPDTLRFLEAIKRKYKPDRIIQIGDEVDGHAWSFHDHDPDLHSPGDELGRAQWWVNKLYKMFPKMDILESNHGSLFYRKQKAAGLPRQIFKDYNEIYGVGSGWKWHFELTIKLPNGRECYFHHYKKGGAVKYALKYNVCACFGHTHTELMSLHWLVPQGLLFGAATGCLIDDKALAFEYNKSDIPRPALGSLLILNSVAIPIPMALNKRARWTGKLV